MKKASSLLSPYNTCVSSCTGLVFMTFINVAVIFLNYILGHYTGFSILEYDFFLFWKILFLKWV